MTCIVNPERRALHSRFHSAGHVVDMAVKELNLNWTPGKGYHFPNGPYIEYKGSLAGIDKDKLKIDIENLCNTFIQEDQITTLKFINKWEMHRFVYHIPENLPVNKPSRVVVYGDFGVPCGGTHVAKLSDKGLAFMKIYYPVKTILNSLN